MIYFVRIGESTRRVKNSIAIFGRTEVKSCQEAKMKKVLILILAATFGVSTMGADSCKTSNEKLQRDSKELEETEKKLERERGCEEQPPYRCPKQ